MNEKRVNILHAIDTPGPGGAETVYSDIVIGMDCARFTSYPVIPAKGWLYDRLHEHGHDPIIIDAEGSFNIGYLWQLVRVIGKHDIALIHSHLLGSNVYCSIAGLLTSTPVISTFHGFVDAEGTGKAMKAKFAVLNKGSRKIVFVSQLLKSHFVEKYGVDPSRAEVIYNGIDTKKFKPGKSNVLRKKLGLDNDDILVGAIGNIRPAKGYDLLLRAAAEVKKQRQGVKFIIAGQGSGLLYQELLSLRDRLDIKDTVFFLGYMEDTVQFLHNIDVFLLSSKSEGFSISLVEAMACGLPVIATRCGGPEEIVEHAVTGIFVQPGDPHLLANAIVDLYKDRSLRFTLAEYASQVAVEKFYLKLMVNQYEKLFEEFCRG